MANFGERRGLMKHIRDLTFIAFMGVVLLSPGASFVSTLCHSSAPKSALEGRERPNLPEITLRVIARGEAQSAFDSILAFSAPNRDNALLTHAKWQRRLILFAARTFSFDAYPTYFGSKYCRIATADAIAAMPGKFSSKRKRKLLDASRRYADIMAKFPNIRWVFGLADRSGYSLASPLHVLVNNPFDYDVFRRYLLANLPERCKVIDLGYDEQNAFYRDFFRTDHHWRIQGALRAYDRIATALDLERIRFEAPAPVTEETFWGSYSRLGLDADVRGEAVYDVAYAGSPLRVEVNGRRQPALLLNYGYGKMPFKQRTQFENVYATWFHNNFKSMCITNDRATRGVLLIIGDSFANCLERFFAESYREVIKLDALTSDVDLSEFLTSRNVDDVLFLFGPNAAIKAIMNDSRVAPGIPKNGT